MTRLQKNMVRYRLFDKHSKLVKGSEEDMMIAKRILHFLNVGEIHLGLEDVAWITEHILSDVGVHFNYSRNGFSAYARIDWGK